VSKFIFNEVDFGAVCDCYPVDVKMEHEDICSAVISAQIANKRLIKVLNTSVLMNDTKEAWAIPPGGSIELAEGKLLVEDKFERGALK